MKRHYIIEVDGLQIEPSSGNNYIKALKEWASDQHDGQYQIPEPQVIEDPWTILQLRYYFGMCTELVRIEGHHNKRGYHTEMMINCGYGEDVMTRRINRETGEIEERLNFIADSMTTIGKEKISKLIDEVHKYCMYAEIWMPDPDEWKKGRRAFKQNEEFGM